jgi:hypothetical protein
MIAQFVFDLSPIRLACLFARQNSYDTTVGHSDRMLFQYTIVGFYRDHPTSV